MRRPNVDETVGKYRGRLEIISLLLHIVAKGPATKTRLMYGAYLSHGQVKVYTDYLLSNGLVHSQRNGEQQQLYALTEKGLKVLRVSETIAELLQSPREGYEGDRADTFRRWETLHQQRRLKPNEKIEHNKKIPASAA